MQDGTMTAGQLDDKGLARVENVKKQSYRVEVGEDQRDWKPDPIDQQKPSSDETEKAKQQIDQERLNRVL
jgi:hypothetical protein